MKDRESHGTANECDIEEPFEIRNVLEKLPKKKNFRDQLDQSVGSY